MEFSGPEIADFRNVESLNRRFLTLLRYSPVGRGLRQMLESSLRPIFASLTDLQIDRLSRVPFLLFSMRERDEEYWRFLLVEDRNDDLLVAADNGSETSQLATAGLAYMWQLARRNPYAARLISGATLNWCEQLAECTLLPILQNVAARDDLLQPRRADDTDFWIKLLGPGLSSRQEIRKAAQLSALQALLTSDLAARYRRLRTAACNSAMPSRQVAEKRDPGRE